MRIRIQILKIIPDPTHCLQPDVSKKENIGYLCAVFRIRPDPKLFGLKDPNPKLSISDTDPDPDPSLFHTKLEICFKNALRSEKIHHNFIHYS